MATIREMGITDYEFVIELMRNTPGVTVRDADSRDATARYLERNPGFSFVAEDSGQIIGCIMSGHDGRRGYLQHLIVLPAFRKQGIATSLIEACLSKLEHIGILKSHVDVLNTNDAASYYWKKQGWTRRNDIHRYSIIRAGSKDA